MRLTIRAATAILLAWAAANVAAQEAYSREAVEARMLDEFRWASEASIRLALDEGAGVLPALEPGRAWDLVVAMATRAETRLRFGDSAGAVRLELRRSYEAVARHGSDREWRRLAKLREKAERAASGKALGIGLGKARAAGTPRGKNGSP